MADRVWARRPLTYCGKMLDRGQVLDLTGAVNDERLTRLGYLEVIKSRTAKTFECGVCGAQFVDEGMRTGHGEKRHRGKDEGITAVAMPVGVGMIDTTGDAEERRLEQVAPLHLDKTEASQKG